ncbi:MAG: hypothetical protein KDE27_26895 [Planctomycetes bacterium]|nr:hypothetical protein [Planctomycetota bacterium]
MQPLRACPWCGARAVRVHVHGHAQCTVCGSNVEPCCDGAAAASEADHDALAPLHADPELLPRMFDRLGGRSATVTRDALVFALTEHLDADVDTARLVLEAAERTGVVVANVSGCYRLG